MPSDTGSQEQAAMHDAARQLGLDPAGAALVSFSSRFIWHLPAEGIALTISRPGTKSAADVAAEIAAVHGAGGAGARAIRRLGGPVDVPGDRFALAYAWISGRHGRPADWPAIGVEVAKLAHADPRGQRRLTWPSNWPDPAWRGVLGQENYAVLSEHCAQAAEALTAMTTGDDHVVLCHGDVQPANVIVDDGGTPWLIDFEYACLAPPEWDPAKLVILATRFGEPDKLDDVITAWPDLDPVRLDACVAAQETQIVAWLAEMELTGTAGAGKEAQWRASTLRTRHARWQHLQ